MVYTGEQKRKYDLEWRVMRRNAWIKSQGDACAKCDSTERLEVDHIDPKLKTMQPAATWSRSEIVRTTELANCQVLCHDCHLTKSALELTEMAGPDIHGTNRTYNNGCRCTLCVAFKKVKNAKRQQT